MMYAKGAVGCACSGLLVLALSGGALAHEHVHDHRLVVVEELPVEEVLWPDGTVVTGPGQRVWKPICGSDLSEVTQADFERIVADVKAYKASEPLTVIDNPARGANQLRGGAGGVNIIFNVSGGLPTGAAAAIAEVEEYIERQFSNPVNVVVSFSMQSMGGGVLGAAGSSYVSPPTWPTMRNALQSSMDLDDVIHDWLPPGSTIPVRYNISSDVITNENRVYATRANYSALAGQQFGTSVSITLNTNFPWDYDPSNGVPGSFWCFQSVLIHEVGHGLGFTSGVDFRNFDMETLDIFRFQRTNYNPSTYNDFETFPRTVHKNSLNDANSDIIVAEYRMEDGNPRQASHFRDNLGIGIMDPTLGGGETFYPNFFRKADLDMFDAIGWDFVDCNNNGINDFFEILDGADDLNGNGILDECECDSAPAEGEAGGVAKNRFISFVPGNAGSQMAIRVRLTNPPAPFGGFADEVRWVGPAVAFESGTNAAGLQCMPHCADWGSVSLLHVYGPDIVPGGEYDVQLADCACDLGFEVNFSAPLTIATAQWGDVVAPFSEDGGSVQPDVADISALVGKFSSAPDAVSLARAKLQPGLLNPAMGVDVVDISMGVSAFTGNPYPFSGPCVCPPAVSCGQACAVDAECGSGLCIDNQCRDACGRCAP